MFCPNCGTQNNDGVKFCANCGTALTPDIPAAAPVQQYNPVNVNPVNAEPVNVAPVYTPVNTVAAQKTNVLCVVGFIVSLASIVLLGTTAIIGLILSIIGLIAANKNNQKGKGMGIAGVIISGILVAVWIFALIYGISDASSSKKKYTRNTERTRVTTEYEETTRRRETERETTEETEETEETTRATTRETDKETEPSESKRSSGLSSVGNAKTGTVKLTEGTWATFHEAGGFSKNVVEHEQAKDIKSGAIIGLFVLDVNYSAEDLAKSQMAAMEQAGVKKPTGARVKLGGYDAIQCYGMYPDGVILVCWFFKGNDGQMRKVTVEFKEENYSIFSMVEKGYVLD